MLISCPSCKAVYPRPTGEDHASKEVACAGCGEVWTLGTPILDHARALWTVLKTSLPKLPKREKRSAPAAYVAKTASVRAATRSRLINRLTPLRAAGWALWGLTATLFLGSFMTSADQWRSVWPPLANVYDRFGPERPMPLHLADTRIRTSVSTDGPVVEIRGFVRNSDPDPLVPELVYIPEGAAVPMRVRLAERPIGTGGERPFHLRAGLPEGAARATFQLTGVAAGAPGTLQLRPSGSGWGESLPQTGSPEIVLSDAGKTK